MKYLSVVFVLAGLFLLSSKTVLANPTNFQKAQNNPQVVAYYAGGLHTIPGEEGSSHWGEDLVMRAGGSGNFQQWFLGWSAGESFHGEHSVWLISRTGNCPQSFMVYVDPNPGWGDYFVDGATYCVKTNNYHLGPSN